MAQGMNVYCFGIGQGQMNIVESYEMNGSKVVGLGVMVFDCGGSGSEPDDCRKMIGKILKRKKNNKNYFDYMFISHTDSDHSNLLGKQWVKDAINNDTKIFYGSKKNFDGTVLGGYIKQLDSEIKFKQKPIQIKDTHLATKKCSNIGCFSEFGLEVITLFAVDGWSDANDASLILAVRVENTCDYVVFTGDATAKSFKHANKIIEGVQKNENFFTKNECVYISAPHHGSWTTSTTKCRRSGTFIYDFKDLKQFGKFIKAKSCVSSSKHRSDWLHSDKDILKATCQNPDLTNQHTLVTNKNGNLRYYTLKESLFTNQTKYNHSAIFLTYLYNIENGSSEFFYMTPGSTDKKQDLSLVNLPSSPQVLPPRRKKARNFSQLYPAETASQIK